MWVCMCVVVVCTCVGGVLSEVLSELGSVATEVLLLCLVRLVCAWGEGFCMCVGGVLSEVLSEIGSCCY